MHLSPLLLLLLLLAAELGCHFPPCRLLSVSSFLPLPTRSQIPVTGFACVKGDILSFLPPASRCMHARRCGFYKLARVGFIRQRDLDVALVGEKKDVIIPPPPTPRGAG